MIQECKGIILRRKPYGDNGFLCDVFTKEYGIRSFIFNTTSSKKKKTVKSLMHPLQPIDIEFFHKEGRGLSSIKDIAPYFTLKDIPYNIFKSTIAVFIADFLKNVIYEENTDKDLYEYIESSILYLDNTDNGYYDFHLFFITHLTKFIGLSPTNNYSEQNNRFDLKTGEFTDSTERYSAGPNTSRALAQLLNTRTDTIDRLKFDKKSRNIILDNLIYYYSLHMDKNINIKSLDIIREIFE